ncbi:MAG TPA: 30S ribosomal protein S6 [Bryobacteraceae bacterium]|jgi:small subunit ribosomal protein S6
MRVYEELFIVKPDTPEEEVDAYIVQIKDLITNGKGTVDKADKWGVRKLAYRVQKYNEGLYVLIQFSAPAELVKEVERRMRVTDTVIKFITVRIDEKLKKIAKRKVHRDKRAARRPAMPVAPPAMMPSPAEPAAAGPAPGMPGAPKPAEPKPAEPKPAAAEAAAVETKPVEPQLEAVTAGEPKAAE